MADMRSKVNMLYSLEQLSAGQTFVHQIHPFAKLTVTAVYLICVASFGRYDLVRFAPFLFYPVFTMSLAEIPWGMIFPRAAVALPFCLFAGISNLLFDHTPLFMIGERVIYGGTVSFFVLFIKTMLCVSAVLILVAITPFSGLMRTLRQLHVPNLFVMLLEMVYRYIGVLTDEAFTMAISYRLRGVGKKWPDIRHFGSFVGQLLLRSADRAERVYQAMQCRLYTLQQVQKIKTKWQGRDWIFLLFGVGSSILFRLIDFISLLGGVFSW